jgi:hypothetical protein
VNPAGAATGSKYKASGARFVSMSFACALRESYLRARPARTTTANVKPSTGNNLFCIFVLSFPGETLMSLAERGEWSFLASGFTCPAVVHGNFPQLELMFEKS